MKIDKRVKILLISTAFLAFLGFLDTSYLTILHYKNIFPPCALAKGCEKVLTSKYSEIGTLPLSLLGATYYLTAIIFLLILFETKKRIFHKLFFILNLIGFLISLLLFSLQAFVIHAFCQYCLFSEFISLVLLTFSIILLRLKDE